MGNTPSTSPKSSQGHLPEISPIGNSKIALVYKNTPTLIYRPATYKEALLEARERFLIPRHDPVELTCQYLSVGYIVVNESNWESVSPTLHTLFVSSKPTPPIPTSETLTPQGLEYEQDSTSHLQLSPFQPTGSISSFQDAEDSTTSHAHQPPAPAAPVAADATGGGGGVVVGVASSDSLVVPPPPLPMKTASNVRPTSLQPLRKNSHDLGTISPLRPVSLLPSHSSHHPSPSVSPSSSRPLPLPPVLQSNPNSLPQSMAPKPITLVDNPMTIISPDATTSSFPRSISFSVCYSESGDNDTSARGDRISLTLPPSTTISNLKDLLAEEFVVPVYSQALWLNQESIDSDENATLEEVGIGDRSHVIVTRT